MTCLYIFNALFLSSLYPSDKFFLHISALAEYFPPALHIRHFVSWRACLLSMHRAYSHGTQMLAKYFLSLTGRTHLCSYFWLAFAGQGWTYLTSAIFTSLLVFSHITKASLLPCSLSTAENNGLLLYFLWCLKYLLSEARWDSCHQSCLTKHAFSLKESDLFVRNGDPNPKCDLCI